MKKKPLFDVLADGSTKDATTSSLMAFEVKNEGDVAEILVHGRIGDEYDGADAKTVMSFLASAKGKPINVRINSPGGLAFDGITIYNALAQHDAAVTTSIEGIAGSAASIIAMAGDTIRIGENATLFIHRAMGAAFGNVSVFDEVRAFLSKVDEQLVATYAARTGRPADEIRELLIGEHDGTIFGGQEAIDAGFADELIPARRKKEEKPKADADARAAVQAMLGREVATRLRLMELDLQAEGLKA